MPEEIANPKCFVEFNDQAYPCYHLNQTEEIKTFNIKPYSVGLDVKEYEEYPCVVNAFDGMGCANTSWMEKVFEKFGLKYTTQGIQIRLPYVKGYVVSFPIKTWAAKNRVRKIKDIWDKEWDLFDDRIDMILTESCFKAKLDNSKEGIQQWLGKHQLFCAGKQGDLIRNPLTHYSEVFKAEFIQSDNMYIKHLNNVCQFPAGHDLSMARLNLDYDGDKVLIVNNPSCSEK